MCAYDVIADLDAKHGIFINGRGLGTASTFEVHDPATREVIAEICDGIATEAASAVQTAHSAFRDWVGNGPSVRAEILWHAFDLMVADADRFASLICIDAQPPAKPSLMSQSESVRAMGERGYPAEGPG